MESDLLIIPESWPFELTVEIFVNSQELDISSLNFLNTVRILSKYFYGLSKEKYDNICYQQLFKSGNFNTFNTMTRDKISESLTIGKESLFDHILNTKMCDMNKLNLEILRSDRFGFDMHIRYANIGLEFHKKRHTYLIIHCKNDNYDTIIFKLNSFKNILSNKYYILMLCNNLPSFIKETLIKHVFDGYSNKWNDVYITVDRLTKELIKFKYMGQMTIEIDICKEIDGARTEELILKYDKSITLDTGL